MDMLWGVSLRLSLSQQDREKNATRSTREIAGIVKNAENASVIEAGEEIEVLLTAEEEVDRAMVFSGRGCAGRRRI